jgi:Transposase IS66 family
VLEIDTNQVENVIRPTKLETRNWMFFSSLEAGENNALIDTLSANCRAQEMDRSRESLPHTASPKNLSTLSALLLY